MPLLTRFATAADIPGIQALAQATLQDATALKRYQTDALQRALNSVHLDWIVAESAGEIVGVVRYGTPILEDCDCEDLKLIHALLVHADASWEAIAEDLLDAVEDSLNADAKIQRIAVYVDPSRADWVRFYAQQGFHHEAPEDEDDLWYMELAL